MISALIDTDILSLFFRNDPNVKKNFGMSLAEYEQVNFSIVTYYEILRGLKYKDRSHLLSQFQDFVNRSRVMPLTKPVCERASDIYAELRGKGRLIGEVDVLIAGTAIANDLVLVTHNTRHFNRIDNLELEDWSL